MQLCPTPLHPRQLWAGLHAEKSCPVPDSYPRPFIYILLQLCTVWGLQVYEEVVAQLQAVPGPCSCPTYHLYLARLLCPIYCTHWCTAVKLHLHAWQAGLNGTHWDSKATWAPEAAPCVGPASPHACNTGMGPKPPRRAPHLLGHASGVASHPPAEAACARFVERGGAWWRQALTIDDGPRGKVAASVSAFKATLYVVPCQLPSGARADVFQAGFSSCVQTIVRFKNRNVLETVARTTASGLFYCCAWYKAGIRLRVLASR